jgi:hypothetical protein
MIDNYFQLQTINGITIIMKAGIPHSILSKAGLLIRLILYWLQMK